MLPISASFWRGRWAVVAGGLVLTACGGKGLTQPPVHLTFAAVSAGYLYTCGLTTAGVAYCWGFNSIGQLGDGTTTDRASPVLVGGGLSFAAVSTGSGHNCGLTTVGAVYCWGGNLHGQLGDGTTTDRSSPVPVVQ